MKPCARDDGLSVRMLPRKQRRQQHEKRNKTQQATKNIGKKFAVLTDYV